MEKLKRAFAFTKSLKTTGAMFETSKKVEKEITRYIDPNTPQVIVEFGAGHGNITRVVLEKMHPESKVIAFEVIPEFCEVLYTIEDERLQIINDSAQHIKKYVNSEVDCIISSIPFSFIPDSVLDEILSSSYAALSNNGTMSQMLFSNYHVNKYKRYFGDVKYKILLSLPLEFIYHAKKQSD